jgi:hypothetical protein
MAMNMAGSPGGGRRGRRRAVMAEINVTPMVDVMLVLLIIFMVSAPLLTVGVPLDLPQTQAKSLEQDKTPLQLSVDPKGRVFINDTERAYIHAGGQEGGLRNGGARDGQTVRRGVQAAGAGHGSGAGVLEA